MKKQLITTIICIISLTTEAQVSVVTVVDSLLLQGKYQNALKLLENQQIKTVATFNKTATIYQSVGNYTKAIENYKKALKIKETDAIKIRLGKAYNSAGLPLNAIKIYEKIIEKDTTNLLVASSLGKLYLSTYKTKNAAEIYEYLKRKDTLNPNYPYQLAIALGRLKKHFKMGDNYLEAYKRDSLHIKSIYRLAKFFKNLRDKDSTMLFIDKGLKIDANNINFNQLKANALYTSKDYKGAIKHLKRLDSLNFKSVNMFELFGLCYLNFKEYDLAEASFKKALDIDKQKPMILYRLAILYYEKGEKSKALLNAMMSVSTAKASLDKQYYLMGTIFKEDNKLKMAIANFKKSFENNSRNHKALFELATTSETYYKDKKIAYNHYHKYVDRFGEMASTTLSHKNSATLSHQERIAFAKHRIKEIREKHFFEGESKE